MAKAKSCFVNPIQSFIYIYRADKLKESTLKIKFLVRRDEPKAKTRSSLQVKQSS